MNRNNVFIIKNDLGITSKLEVNYIITKENKYDAINYLLISESILERTKNLKKEELVEKAASLYDFDYAARTQTIDNLILFKIEISYLNIDDPEYQKSIEELVHEIFEEVYLDKSDLKVTIEDYKTYFQQIEDSPSNYAQRRMKDFIYSEDDLHLSFFEAREYLDRIDLDELLGLKIIGRPKLYFLETSDAYLDSNQKILENIFEKTVDSFEGLTITRPNIDERYIKNIDEAKSNSQVTIQILFETLGSYDKYTMQVFNALFGGGSVSKLFMNVREKENLSYSIYSRIVRNIGVLVFTEVSRQSVEKAHSEIKQQLEDIRDGKIDEFRLVKDKIISDYLKSRQSYALNKGLIVDELIDLELKKKRTILPKTGEYTEIVDEIISRIEAVTEEQVINLAKELVEKIVYLQN